MHYSNKSSKYGSSSGSGSSGSSGYSSGPLNSLLLGRYDYGGSSGGSSFPSRSPLFGGGSSSYGSYTSSLGMGYGSPFGSSYGGGYSSGYSSGQFSGLATISEHSAMPSSSSSGSGRRLPRGYVPASLFPNPGNYNPPPPSYNKKPAVFDTENIDVTSPRKLSNSDSTPTATPGEITREKTFGTIKRGRTVIRIRTKNQKENPYLTEEEQLERAEVRKKEKERDNLVQKLRDELRNDIDDKKTGGTAIPGRKAAGDKFREKFMIQSKKKKYAGYRRPTLSDIRSEQALLQKELQQRLAIVEGVEKDSEVDLEVQNERLEQVKERLGQLDRRIERRYSKALKNALASTTEDESSTEGEERKSSGTVKKLKKSSSRNTLKLLMGGEHSHSQKSVPTTPQDEDKRSPMLKRKATQKFFFPAEGSSSIQREIVDVEAVPQPEDDFEKNILAHRNTLRKNSSHHNIKYIHPRKSSLDVVDILELANTIVGAAAAAEIQMTSREVTPSTTPSPASLAEDKGIGLDCDGQVKPKKGKVVKKRKTAVITPPMLDSKLEKKSSIIIPPSVMDRLLNEKVASTQVDKVVPLKNVTEKIVEKVASTQVDKVVPLKNVTEKIVEKVAPPTKHIKPEGSPSPKPIPKSTSPINGVKTELLQKKTASPPLTPKKTEKIENESLPKQDAVSAGNAKLANEIKPDSTAVINTKPIAPGVNKQGVFPKPLLNKPKPQETGATSLDKDTKPKAIAQQTPKLKDEKTFSLDSFPSDTPKPISNLQLVKKVETDAQKKKAEPGNTSSKTDEGKDKKCDAGMSLTENKLDNPMPMSIPLPPPSKENIVEKFDPKISTATDEKISDGCNKSELSKSPTPSISPEKVGSPKSPPLQSPKTYKPEVKKPIEKNPLVNKFGLKSNSPTPPPQSPKLKKIIPNKYEKTKHFTFDNSEVKSGTSSPSPDKIKSGTTSPSLSPISPSLSSPKGDKETPKKYKSPPLLSPKSEKNEVPEQVPEIKGESSQSVPTLQEKVPEPEASPQKEEVPQEEISDYNVIVEQITKKLSSENEEVKSDDVSLESILLPSIPEKVEIATPVPPKSTKLENVTPIPAKSAKLETATPKPAPQPQPCTSSSIPKEPKVPVPVEQKIKKTPIKSKSDETMTTSQKPEEKVVPQTEVTFVVTAPWRKPKPTQPQSVQSQPKKSDVAKPTETCDPPLIPPTPSAPTVANEPKPLEKEKTPTLSTVAVEPKPLEKEKTPTLSTVAVEPKVLEKEKTPPPTPVVPTSTSPTPWRKPRPAQPPKLGEKKKSKSLESKSKPKKKEVLPSSAPDTPESPLTTPVSGVVVSGEGEAQPVVSGISHAMPKEENVTHQNLDDTTKAERDNKNESPSPLKFNEQQETSLDASSLGIEPKSEEVEMVEQEQPPTTTTPTPPERLSSSKSSGSSSSTGSGGSTLTAKSGSTSSTGSSSASGSGGSSRPRRLPSPPVDDDSDEETVSLDKICPAKNRPKYRKYEIEDFQFLKVLGKGSFGKVLLAELKDADSSYFAIKCLKKDVVLEDDDVECTMIERKVLLMGSKHPYLCHLFCTFQTESHLFFVMEYLNGGDLMFHIQQSGKFTEERARFYAAEIVSGLKFLHKKGVMYRDLKLDNILLDYEGHIRIADFGMCKLQVYLDRTADTFCGTPDYMAPEIIKGLRYNQCVDWWAFGVLLYEMLVGQSPFSGCDEDELFWSICNEPVHFPRFLSKECKWILERLLEKDASRRLGMASCAYGDVQKQVFFNSIDWEKMEKKELEPPFRPKLKHPLDVQYFDTTFTKEAARLTPVDKAILQSIDQSQFDGFSYTNPHTTD